MYIYSLCGRRQKKVAMRLMFVVVAGWPMFTGAHKSRDVILNTVLLYRIRLERLWVFNFACGLLRPLCTRATRPKSIEIDRMRVVDTKRTPHTAERKRARVQSGEGFSDKNWLSFVRRFERQSTVKRWSHHKNKHAQHRANLNRIHESVHSKI